jgi:hypothetical protein
MRFESQWPSHASADPLGARTIGKTCSSKGSAAGSWNPADRHSDRADADPMVVILKDWRHGDKSGTGISAPNSERRLQPAGVDTDTAPPDFAGWRAWIASIVAELWSRIPRETRDPPYQSGGLRGERRPNG